MPLRRAASADGCQGHATGLIIFLLLSSVRIRVVNPVLTPDSELGAGRRIGIMIHYWKYFTVASSNPNTGGSEHVVCMFCVQNLAPACGSATCTGPAPVLLRRLLSAELPRRWALPRVSARRVQPSTPASGCVLAEYESGFWPQSGCGPREGWVAVTVWLPAESGRGSVPQPDPHEGHSWR
jgi:hypothetical protein